MMFLAEKLQYYRFAPQKTNNERRQIFKICRRLLFDKLKLDDYFTMRS
jgi:hypothetical protein